LKFFRQGKEQNGNHKKVVHISVVGINNNITSRNFQKKTRSKTGTGCFVGAVSISEPNVDKILSAIVNVNTPFSTSSY